MAGQEASILGGGLAGSRAQVEGHSSCASPGHLYT